MTKYVNVIKQALGPKVSVRPFKDNMLVVAPGGFFPPSRLKQMADTLADALPEAEVSVGQGGVTEGMIVVRLPK